jgi:hypothetical protein
LGILPHQLGQLAGKRLKKRDLLTDPEGRLIELALETAGKPRCWKGWEESEAFATGLRLAEYSAASGEVEACETIAQALPGRKSPPSLFRRLVWRAGGSEEARGLTALIKATSPENWVRQMRAALLWRHGNLETETRRRAEITLAFPDFDPSSPKWGAYLGRKIEEAGIKLNRRRTKAVAERNLPQDPSTLIIGESHGKGIEATLGVIAKEASQGATLLTVEEPKDASWKPLMGFLLQTKKDWGPSEIIARAREEYGETPLTARLAAMAYAKNLGMEICFVDATTEEKKRLRAQETRMRRRVIAQGEPFDANRPETALGGPRALAATILKAYHNTKRRSRQMAKAIARMQRGNKLVHLGGALHAEDIALALAKRGKVPRIFWGEGLENPLANALGITGGEELGTKEREKTPEEGRGDKTVGMAM